MRRMFIGAALLLTACGEAKPDMTDAEAVAMVEAAQDRKPPAEQLALQPIGAPDYANPKLADHTACAFAPGNSMGAVLIAQQSSGFIKLGGKLIELAADSGSARLPGPAHTRYSGQAHAILITATASGRGELIISDAYQREVYRAEGTLQCDA